MSLYLLLTTSLTSTPDIAVYHDEPPAIDSKRRRLANNGPRIVYGPTLIPHEYEHLPLDTLRDIALGRKPLVKL